MSLIPLEATRPLPPYGCLMSQQQQLLKIAFIIAICLSVITLKIACLEQADSLVDFKPSHQGHAIEVRINAEDPFRDFAPSAGTLGLVEWPECNSETGRQNVFRLVTAQTNLRAQRLSKHYGFGRLMLITEL